MVLGGVLHRASGRSAEGTAKTLIAPATQARAARNAKKSDEGWGETTLGYIVEIITDEAKYPWETSFDILGFKI
jgi:hypothetical protein